MNCLVVYLLDGLRMGLVPEGPAPRGLQAALWGMEEVEISLCNNPRVIEACSGGFGRAACTQTTRKSYTLVTLYLALCTLHLAVPLYLVSYPL